MSDEQQDIFARLRSGGPTTSSSSPYSFTGVQPSRAPSPVMRPANAGSPRPETRQGPTIVRAERNSDGDRIGAHEVPVLRKQEDLHEWEPPTFGEILKDLGLRVLEVAVAAAAFAAGEEIAYFFRRRRLYPRKPTNYRE